jgi:4-amino-4-deoxy-L-arabinose transferase-like glycosyltransferase
MDGEINKELSADSSQKSAYNWFVTLSQLIITTFSVYFILVFLYVAFSRITYPFELEWMEGATVDHVVRLMQGMDIYVKPTFEFIPYRYTPFYYWVSLIPVFILGPGFLSLRLVSLLATLGCLGIIYLWVYRETNKFLPAIIAAGFYAATFFPLAEPGLRLPGLTHYFCVCF